MTSHSARTSLLLLALAVIVLLVGTLLPPLGPTNAQGLPPDFAVPSGRFFTQTRGDAPPNFGYMISDDNVSSFWRDFQRFGGVDVVGYPVTHRFLYNGSVIQAMQKVVFRWDPVLNTTTFVNVFDELSAAGYDQWLLSQQVPLSRDWSADANRSFPEIIRAHQALLDEDPAIKAAYFAAGDNALALYGLPMGTGDYPTVFVIRAQRAVFQRWKVDTPWARAGQVTIANGGDIFKASGLLPFNAVLPATLSGQLFLPNTPTPSATPTPTATPTITPTPTQTPTVAPTGTPAPTLTPAGSGTIYFNTFEAIVQRVVYTTTLQGSAGFVNAFAQWAVVFLRIRNNGPEPNFLAPEDLIFFDSAGRLGTPDVGAGQRAAQEQFGRAGPYEVFQPTFFNEVVLVWQLPVESSGGGVVANVPYGLPQPPPFARVSDTTLLRFGDTWEMLVTDAVATTSIGQPNACQYPRGIFLVVFARVRNISTGPATIRLNDVRIQDGAGRTFDFTFQHIQLAAQAGFNRPAGVGTTFQPNETRDVVLVFDVAFESVGRLNGLTPRFTPQLHPSGPAIDLGVVRTLPVNPGCIRGSTPPPNVPTAANTPTPTPTPTVAAVWRTVFSTTTATLRALAVWDVNNVVAVGDGGAVFRGGGSAVPASFTQVNASISPPISPSSANLRGVKSG
ncbi:MAG: DUF4352 domain-containing protein, partial [Dehalococcoidia bacterium]|nr:DUF4352 domain-containing protein [Dehalococcoidia bacterium]